MKLQIHDPTKIRTHHFQEGASVLLEEPYVDVEEALPFWQKIVE